MRLFQIQEFDALLCDGTLNFSGKRNEKATDISVAFFRAQKFSETAERPPDPFPNLVRGIVWSFLRGCLEKIMEPKDKGETDEEASAEKLPEAPCRCVP